MYTPERYRENDLPTLHGLMRQNSFATLIAQSESGVSANHLPLLLDGARGKYGVLRGHMAKANGLWRSFSETDAEILVIFHGPHAYISPSWYEAGTNVPTWNYAAVHAYGSPRIIQDQKEFEQLLEDSVQVYESKFEKPWIYGLSENDKHKMMKAIVGFEIEITRLEGKLKISQNKSESDRERVIDALSQSSEQMDRDVAELMKEYFAK